MRTDNHERSATSGSWRRDVVLLVVVLGLVAAAAAVMLRWDTHQVTAADLGCLSTPGATIDGVPTGQTCADSGFRPARDGFSFANWPGTRAGDAISVDTMVALFGRKQVCIDADQPTCTPVPEAVQWARQLNEILAHGRCEGMSVAAERFYSGLTTVRDLDPRATSVQQLARQNPRLIADIDYWWATQVLPEVVDAAAASRELPPSRIVEQVVSGLRNGASNTLGIYSDTGAHSLTPFAVTYDAPSFSIWVYDANRPGRAGRVVVDPTTETWEYRPTPDATSDVRFRGSGPGGLEYTPMQVRMQDFQAPFADRAGQVFASVIADSPDSTDRVDLRLTTPNGIADSRRLADAVADVTVNHVEDDGIGDATVAYLHSPMSVSMVPVSSEGNVPVHLSVDGPTIPWQEVTFTTPTAGDVPLSVELSPDSGTRYRMTGAGTAQIVYVGHDGQEVRRTLVGPGELSIPLLADLPSAGA